MEPCRDILISIGVPSTYGEGRMGDQHKLKPDETWISVTYDETDLIANIIYVALKNMHALNDRQRKEAQSFMVKLQRAALSISKQPTH
jgi:hypothetical protein